MESLENTPMNDELKWLLKDGGGVTDGGKNELEALSCSFCPKCYSFEWLRSEKRTASVSQRRNVCTKCRATVKAGMQERGTEVICKVRHDEHACAHCEGSLVCRFRRNSQVC